MPEIRILAWRKTDPVGEPDVEIRMPVALAKWIPKLMWFVPRKTRIELWGEDADFASMLGNIQQLIQEAAEGGIKEIMDVKTRDSHVKVLVEP